MFQRIWSGRVTTERKAWELLSLIDQIHLWGATDFRQFVMKHLQPWYAFAEKCYHIDAVLLLRNPGLNLELRDGTVWCQMPSVYVDLADWAQHITDDARDKLQNKLSLHVVEACVQFRYAESLSIWGCSIDDCASSSISLYPIATLEEVIRHLSEIHGIGDADIAEYVQNSTSQLSNEPQATRTVTTNPPLELRGIKRHVEDAGDTAEDKQAAKKGRK